MRPGGRPQLCGGAVRLLAGSATGSSDVPALPVHPRGLGAGLWLWMAWANRRGHLWARIVAAVFFAINTLDLIFSFARIHAVGAVIVSVLVWLVGLWAIVLLFNKQSAPFFAQRSVPRQPSRPG